MSITTNRLDTSDLSRYTSPMAQAYIYSDETYRSQIDRKKESDKDFPEFYVPVEVPDELLATYEAAHEAERTLRHHIVALVGESRHNPEYLNEWAEYDHKQARAWNEQAWNEYLGTGEIHT